MNRNINIAKNNSTDEKNLYTIVQWNLLAEMQKNGEPLEE